MFSFIDIQEELKDAFNVFDKDGDGYLAKHEFETAMRNLGDGLSEEELERMLNGVRYDIADKISYDNFVAFIRNSEDD